MILRAGWKLGLGDHIVIGLDDVRPWTVTGREAIATASIRDNIWVTLEVERDGARGTVKMMVDDLVWTKPQIVRAQDAAA